MVSLTKLLEREGRSTVLDYSIALVCGKEKSGALSLALVESSDLGDLRHPVAKRIRSPRAFIDAVMSLMEWTELEIDYDVIVDEICAALRELDADFADSVVDQIETDRSGAPARGRKLRA